MIAKSGRRYRSEYLGDTAGIAEFVWSERRHDERHGPSEWGHQFYLARAGRHVVNDSSEDIGEGIGHRRYPTVKAAETAVLKERTWWTEWVDAS